MVHEFLLEQWVSEDCAKICLAAYLDVQKAFDTINHGILLARLEACGMGNK